MKIKSFKDLSVWSLGKEIVLSVYEATKTFPKEELYGLSSQMRRASVSIPSNIAEGYNRFHKKEYRQFLFIALGSCAELETHVELANDLKLLNEEMKIDLLGKIDHETRMLHNLVKKLES